MAPGPGLWDFDIDEDAHLSDSAEEGPSTKRKALAIDPESLVPPEKRAKIRQKYGGASAGRAQDNPPVGTKQNLEEQTPQGPEESDSDIEALRETTMLEGGAEGRHKKKTPDFQAAPLDGAAWEKLQLLARVKSIMTKKSEQEEKEDMLDDDDEDVRLAEDASPGTVGAASPYAGRRSQQKFTPTDLDYLHSSKGVSSPGSRHAPKRKIMLKVVDHAQHVLDARVKVGDQLSVLFNAFTKQASDKEWLPTTSCSVTFTLNEKEIAPTETAASLGIADGAILIAIYNDTTSLAGVDPIQVPLQVDNDRIHLKVQDRNGNIIKIRLRRNDPFGKLFHGYKKQALEKGWLPSADCKLKFTWDGDRVEETSTPADLGLDEDEVIDVIYQ